MGIKDLNWLNSSYNKNGVNNAGNGGNVGGNVDTSKFVSKSEFYQSQNAINTLVNNNTTAITELQTEFNNLDFSEFVSITEFNKARADLSNRIMENKIEIDSNQSLINDIHNQISNQNQTNNNYFSEINKKIEANIAEIEQLKQNGGNGNIDTSNFVTKTDFDNSQNAQDEKIAKNTNDMTILTSGLVYINDSQAKTEARLDAHIENQFRPLFEEVNNNSIKIGENTSKINANTAEIEKLKLNGGGSGGNIDTSNFVTKAELDKATNDNYVLIRSNSTDIEQLQDLYDTNIPKLDYAPPNYFKTECYFKRGVTIEDTIYTAVKGTGPCLSPYEGQLMLGIGTNSLGTSFDYEPTNDYSIVHKYYVDKNIEKATFPITWITRDLKLLTNRVDVLEKAPNADLSNYYNKTETNNLISPINTRVDEAYTKIRENNTAITGLQDQNKTLQQSITQNQTQIAQNTADILDLKNKPGVDLSNYYTINQWDKMFQGMEMTGPTPIITDFGKKALLVFQVSTDNIKLADFIGNIPSEIANWRNIANIESATVNAVNADSDILTKPLDLLISHYNGRLFVKSYNNLPSDVKYIRFRIWVNKK